MFTGIIETLGTVKASETSAGRQRLIIESVFTDLALGESVAVQGVCLTVAELDGPRAHYFVSHESLARTALGELKVGARVNLERALTLSTRLSGHLVQGHVDGTGRITALSPKNESVELAIEVPAQILRYCIDKGSITIDGVSLTINRIEGRTLHFNLIPHTWKATQFSEARVGQNVNLEADLIAKYVERLARTGVPHAPAP